MQEAAQETPGFESTCNGVLPQRPGGCVDQVPAIVHAEV